MRLVIMWEGEEEREGTHVATHSLLGDHHHVVCYCEGVDVTPAIVRCGCDTCYCEVWM